MKAVSGKHLCRVLENKGWRLKRVHGSHYIYAHPDHAGILTIPVHGHRDLKQGILAQLLKCAGLEEKDV